MLIALHPTPAPAAVSAVVYYVALHFGRMERASPHFASLYALIVALLFALHPVCPLTPASRAAFARGRTWAARPLEPWFFATAHRALNRLSRREPDLIRTK